MPCGLPTNIVWPVCLCRATPGFFCIDTKPSFFRLRIRVHWHCQTALRNTPSKAIAAMIFGSEERFFLHAFIAKGGFLSAFFLKCGCGKGLCLTAAENAKDVIADPGE